jgi:hypothetical protein
MNENNIYEVKENSCWRCFNGGATNTVCSTFAAKHVGTSANTQKYQ